MVKPEASVYGNAAPTLRRTTCQRSCDRFSYASGKMSGLLEKSALALVGAAIGGFNKAAIAIDIRIVASAPIEVSAATRVEGVAKVVHVGALH